MVYRLNVRMAFPWRQFPITNGFSIVGTVEHTGISSDVNGHPHPAIFYSGGYSNHIVAYVHSISGPAIEKPLQDNDIVRGDSFGYRLLCVNAPVADRPLTNLHGRVNDYYTRQLAANLHELRLTFLWPQQPNGSVGPGRQTFRTLVAGQDRDQPSLTGRFYIFTSRNRSSTSPTRREPEIIKFQRW